MKVYVHLLQYLAKFFLEREMFQTKCVEKIKTRVLCAIFFFENRPVCVIMLKNMVSTDRPGTAVAQWLR